MLWKTKILFDWCIVRFHVNLLGCKSSMLVLSNDMKFLFLPAVLAQFQAGELGEIHFGLGTTPAKWCAGRFISSWCKDLSINSSNIEANGAQTVYPLRVSVLYISATSKVSCIFELVTPVLHVWQVCWFWSMFQNSWPQYLLEGPFQVESGPGFVEPSSLHKLWRHLKQFATKELFGMSLRARRVLDAYAIHLSNQELKRKFLRFKLAWHKV